jgi:hypothetical protein
MSCRTRQVAPLNHHNLPLGVAATSPIQSISGLSICTVLHISAHQFMALCPKLQSTQTMFPLPSRSLQVVVREALVIDGVKFSLLLTSTPFQTSFHFLPVNPVSSSFYFFPRSSFIVVQYLPFSVIHSSVSTDTSLPSRPLTTQGQQTISTLLSEHSHFGFGDVTLAVCN